MRANERHWRGDAEMDAELLEVWRVMQARVERGCSIDGELPGPWRVKRRAPALYRKLSRPGAGPSTELRTGLTDPLAVLDWVNLWALAVNEENAAEIGMEHHLGLTCDPVGGLVQIPCIERNAIAAAEAINAARMALAGDATHYASLDQVIKTMRETGADMKTTYKETARGGLAVNVVAC
jgi:L-serine deaminase